MDCTWKGCCCGAKNDQKDRDGRVWARLCDYHHDELEKAIASLSPPKMCRAWVLAQGGAEEAAKRM